MIHRIALRNFRGIKKQEITGIKGNALLIGKNGAGKSTFLSAISMLLYGKCLDANGKQILLRSMVSTKDGGGIDIDFTTMSAGLVVTEKTTDLNVRGLPHVSTNHRADILDVLKIKPRVGEFKANTACILTPEFGQLLAEHIGTITPDTLREFCGDENFEWLKSWNRNVLPLNADMCANVGKSAESDRRQAKKNLDAITRGIESCSNVEQPRDKKGRLLGSEDLPKIRQYSLGMREKLTQLKLELGAAMSAMKYDRAEVQKRVDMLAEKKQEAEKAYSEASGKVNAAGEKLRETTKARMEIDSHYRGIDMMIDSLAKTRDSYQVFKVGDPCPTCGAAITQECVTSLLKKTDGEIQAKSYERESAMEKLTEMHDKEEILRRGHAELLAVQDAAMDEMIKATSAHGAAVQMLEQCQESRPREDIEKDIADTEAKYERAEVVLSQLEVWLSKEKQEDEAKECAWFIEKLDWAVKSFRDGEFIKSCIGKAMDSFLSSVNVIIGKFGRSLDVDISGKVVSLSINGVALAECSAGERKMAEIALALAFPDTGGPVLIDDLNHLAGADLSTAMKLLMGAKSQVFAACAWKQTQQDVIADMAQKLNAQVFWIGE